MQPQRSCLPYCLVRQRPEAKPPTPRAHTHKANQVPHENLPSEHDYGTGRTRYFPTLNLRRRHAHGHAENKGNNSNGDADPDTDSPPTLLFFGPWRRWHLGRGRAFGHGQGRARQRVNVDWHARGLGRVIESFRVPALKTRSGRFRRLPWLLRIGLSRRAFLRRFCARAQRQHQYREDKHQSN